MSIRRPARIWKEGTWMKIRNPEILKALMATRSLSVRDLAAMASLKPAIVGHLRSGKRNSCSPITAERLSSALCVSLDVLFDANQPTSVVELRARARLTEPVAA